MINRLMKVVAIKCSILEVSRNGSCVKHVE